MKITQEEKVLVAVTKKEEPPRARGTAVFPYVSMMDALVVPYVNIALSYSLYKYTDYGVQREGWSLSFFKMLWNV